MLFKVEQQNKLVIQHNDLLNGRYSFSLNELRIFVYMLMEIKKGDASFRHTQVPCSVLHDHNSRVNYELIRQASKNLAKKIISVEQCRGGKKSWADIPLMAYCRYIQGDGYLETQFNEHAKPYLLNLTANFTAAEFQQFMEIKTPYAFRVYWLLRQYSDFSRRTFQVQELRELLELEDKYPLYKDFKRRVLLPVQKELSKTDMDFELIEHRLGGRGVKRVEFIFGSARRLPSSTATSRRSRSAKAASAPAPSAQPQINISFPSTHDRFDSFMLKHGFSEKDIEQLKARLDQHVYHRILHWFMIDRLPTMHPKEVRSAVLSELAPLLKPEK